MVTGKGDHPTPEQQAVIDEVAAWIDPAVIATAIARELVDEGITVTLTNCQASWYRVLEELHHHVKETIPHLP